MVCSKGAADLRTCSMLKPSPLQIDGSTAPGRALRGALDSYVTRRETLRLKIPERERERD